MSSDTQQMDKRMTCRYGVRCYQKNPDHHKKYKHPPKPKRTQQDINPLKQDEPTAKKPRTDDVGDVCNDTTETKAIQTLPTKIDKKPKAPESPKSNAVAAAKHSNDISDSSDEETTNKDNDITMKDEVERVESLNAIKVDNDNSKPYKDLEPKAFIKEHFLVDMPDDFYKFWDFCKSINGQNPSAALRDADLLLVGPYDVLNGKFENADKEYSEKEFLVHWRYYYDPPEFQTVLKGSDVDGFHIGYFRDEPNKKLVFMASNIPKHGGTITSCGENIFAAVCLYLEEKQKTCDPFRKLKITKFLKLIKSEANNLKYSLERKTDDMKTRDRSTVAKSFNKIGLVVPYNRKTELGYRELYMNDKDLNNILKKIKQVDDPKDQEAICDKLQPLFTYTNIAIDECDFGTGIELGWNLLFYGINRLNKTIARFLRNSYNLLDRNAFADIIVAHMDNRRKGTKLSIL